MRYFERPYPYLREKKSRGSTGTSRTRDGFLKQLHNNKMQLGDALFLQRYFKWAGHIARGGAKHVSVVYAFRDQFWWEHQQTKKEGFRHAVANAHIHTWEGIMVEALGSCWKESAQNRERWQKLIPLFLEIFQKHKQYPRRRTQKRKRLEEDSANENGNSKRS